MTKQSLTQLLTPKPRKTAAAVLTADEKANIKAVVDHFEAPGFVLSAGAAKSDKTPLTEREKMFLSQEGILRFLDVHETVDATVAALEKTVVWRRDIGVDDVEGLAANVKDDLRFGQGFVLGFDPANRPIIYFFPKKDQVPGAERRSVPNTYIVNRATDLMADGVTTMIVVYYFGGDRKGDNMTLSVSKENIANLEAHAPEQLANTYFMRMPWAIKMFMNLLWPFMSARTTSKIKTVNGEDAIKAGDFNADEFLKECGGKLDWTYDHDTYYPSLLKLCQERREDAIQRWRKLEGPQVGREERLFKVSPGTA